jgi:hypothetical protein
VCIRSFHYHVTCNKSFPPSPRGVELCQAKRHVVSNDENHLLSQQTSTIAGSNLFTESLNPTMQSFLTPMSPMTTLPTQVGSADPVRAAVGHLLSRAYSLPCSTAAQAFTQLVQPTSRFQLALDALLPLLDPNVPAEVRINVITQGSH